MGVKPVQPELWVGRQYVVVVSSPVTHVWGPYTREEAEQKRDALAENGKPSEICGMNGVPYGRKVVLQ